MAKHQNKVNARLKLRIEEWEMTLRTAESRFRRGYKKPGSQNLRK